MVRFLDIFKKLKPPETESGSAPDDALTATEPKKPEIKLPLSNLQAKNSTPPEAIPSVVNAQIINTQAPVRTDIHPEGSRPERSAAILQAPAFPTKNEYLGVHFATTGQAQGGEKIQFEEKPALVQQVRPVESPYSRAMAQTTNIEQTAAGNQAGPQAHSQLNLSGIIKAQENQEIRKALELYDNLASLSQLILEHIDKKISLKAINLKSIANVIREMASLIVSGDRGLLDLIYRSSRDNYLIAHLVNTSIISMEVGKGLGYNPSRLEELGLAAFLHDVGMQEVYSLIYHRDKLSRQEYEKVKMHVVAGANLLKEIDGLPPAVLEVCTQHHERITGDGYRGMSGKTINEYAQVIGLADTFEAITHSRPYRRQKSGQAAIKDLIETASDLFDRKALKVLVKRIGIYPVGTWVELNTGEIARVIRVNETFPIRPTVTIMTLADKSTPVETKTIDLTKNQNIYIKTTLDEEELLGKTPK